ncbi:MAG: response regulator transcription factor [Pseudomonadota bacterium]|nr:response regulator transcription factor [Pseudomonadota bacterium]MDE3038491.1 response regulator transcription factor [Pseudomonadota bacterium]
MTIVIISKDRDFAQPLAEQVKKELSLDCRIADTANAAGGATLVVTTENGGQYACPVVMVANPPVKLSDVLADIKTALRRFSGGDDMALGGGYLLHPRRKRLLYASSGRAVDVTDKEAQLLRVLAEAGQGGVTKERLLREVWDIEAALNTHTLETHVYRLRGKFRELAGDEVIEAVGGGYRLKEDGR